MAIVEVYCDPSISGYVGDGSIGNPYSDIQWAINNTSIGGVGTFATRLNIKAGGPWTFGSTMQNIPNAQSQRPFLIEGYTSVAGDGGRPHINCGDAFIDSSNQDHVHISNLDLYNNNGAHVIHLDRNCSINNCYIEQSGTGGLIYIDNGSVINDCYLKHSRVNGYSYGVQGLANMNAKMHGCVVDFAGTGFCILDVDVFNSLIILRSSTATGIRLGNKGVAMGNIVYNDNASGNNSHGISVQSQDGTFIVRDNYVEGFDAGAAYRVQSSKPNSVLMINNHYHNCGDAVDQTSGAWSYGFSSSMTEPTQHASTLLTDVAGGDYSLNEATIRDAFVNPGNANAMSLYTMRHLFDDTFGGGGSGGGGGGSSYTNVAAAKFTRLE